VIITRKALIYLSTSILLVVPNVATARSATLGRTAEPTPPLIDQLFRDRIELMARRGLRKIKKTPNTFDQYVARKLLSTTLKGLGYILHPPPYKRENAS
jgi:hypothetical protein